MAFEIGGPDTVANVVTTSYAVFGEVNRTLSDTLSMVAGFRYTDEEKEVEVATMYGGRRTPTQHDRLVESRDKAIVRIL